ncbi:MAG TPA: NADH:flavin oxidoreductase/NADH oxidase [Tepidisphaeraceae bacterium]|jgi:2,4-dienoyl-CoA reductase-like NADH-dependent reductase (Old Yellow Enzyme family)|nr:NADH:flavin oxidoreductase/NADH oxidase [Tepidisphaeraceae bacterium]
MSELFSPLKIRDVTLRNRVGVSPMCQYSCEDGFATDWHLVHLGSRAVGGAGLVIAEATGVEARGRISPNDLGIWKDEHVEPLARAARFVEAQGAVAGIQIAHAGRKASTSRPWEGHRAVEDGRGGWEPIGPSAVAFDKDYRMPREMTEGDIKTVQGAFAAAAKRAAGAGFRWLEIHSAHGYLSHSFLSPLSNRRTDRYGGEFENRIRFLLETVREVRKVWPEGLPLTVRISATDWVEGGWDLEQSIELARHLKKEGVDLIDCSSGGLSPNQKIELRPGYQVPFADAIRAQAGIATAAVGLITEARQADEIIRAGQADMVLLAREMLRDPYWAIHAAKELGKLDSVKVPVQYGRAF